MSTVSYTAPASAPRFSASWAVAGSQAYQASLQRKKRQEQRELELARQQQNSIMEQQLFSYPNLGPAPLRQDCFQTQKLQQVRFSGDPILTWAWLGQTFAAEGIGSAFKWLIGLVKDSPSEERHSSRFNTAKTFLEIAEATEGKDQKRFMEKAESSFIKAVDELSYPLYKGDCYKFAAICAKALDRSPRTVKALADKAYEQYLNTYNRTLDGYARSEFNYSDIPDICNQVTESDSYGKMRLRSPSPAKRRSRSPDIFDSFGDRSRWMGGI